MTKRRGERDPDRERHWRALLERQRASGVSIQEFCQQQGLAQSAFYHWRREIRLRDRETQPNPAKKSNRPSSSEFAEVRVTNASTECDVAVLEVWFGESIRIRVPAGFCVETLRAVFTLVEPR